MIRKLLAAVLVVAPAALMAQPTPSGFLCCNMRTDGSWISDINYAEGGKRIVPLGTPVKVTGYGRFRVRVEFGDGSKQAIGNDYSRDLELGKFMERYVVAEDPKLKLAKYPEKIRKAIESARVMPGMTREQVFMAVGYPVSSENPNLEARVLRFWLSSFAEFQLLFNDKGVVTEITTDPQTRNLVVME